MECSALRYTTFLRHALSILLGYASLVALLSSPIAGAPVLLVTASEAVRGALTLAIGPLTSLGIAAAQAVQSLACLGAAGAIGRFTLLIPPNLLLGLLWQRYRLRGGLAALALSGLWQLAILKPDLWLLPAAGFIAAATFLLYPIFFQKPVKHATETQAS